MGYKIDMSCVNKYKIISLYVEFLEDFFMFEVLFLVDLIFILIKCLYKKNFYKEIFFF